MELDEILLTYRLPGETMLRTLERLRSVVEAADEAIFEATMSKEHDAARVLQRAVAVFGDVARARDWMRSRAYGLRGAMPLALLADPERREQVRELLERLENGDYS